ncbi:MAG TPA: ABC transporter permease [Ktedonobacteraceae bacterium]|nr:ABC transporter permease [Ktedonobacteraceae bacterium]
MLRFLLSRAIGLVFVLLCVTFITFILGYFAPGDPIRVMMGDHFNPALYAALRHTYGLDLPWWQQYLNFVANVLHGTFGLSFHYQGREAWDVLKEGLPFSVELGLESFAVTLIIGIPAGIIAALRSNTYVDTTVSSTMLLLYSIPDIVFIVFFQIFMVWLYNQGLPYLPVAGWDTWQSRIGPVLITGTTGVGYFARLTKTTVLEVLGQDYVRTARAKGLIERVVIFRHTLRNAAIPLITVIGPSLAFIVTGVFITEQFFNIPGVSSITLDAIAQRDYPIIQATTVLTAAMVVLFNALTDLTYAMIDPRIHAE